MRSQRTTLLLAALALAALVAPARAGINLSWSNCATTAASADKSYACNDSLGETVITLEGSFRAPVSISDFSGCSSTITVAFATAIPDFWKTLYGECNYPAFLLVNPTASAPCASPNLFDPSYSVGGYSIGYPDPHHLRIRIDWATGAPTPPSMVAGNLYPAFKFDLDTATATANSCPGCAQMATFTLEWIEVFGFAHGEDYLITSPDTRNTVTWQGAVVPTKNRSWGAIKALYR